MMTYDNQPDSKNINNQINMIQEKDTIDNSTNNSERVSEEVVGVAKELNYPKENKNKKNIIKKIKK